MMKRFFGVAICFLFVISAFAQANTLNDTAATHLLQRVSDKYKSYKNISAGFKLLVINPKVKPTDDEKKLTDTLKGDVTLEGAKFKINIKDQQVICDGKNIWTYIPDDKEVQVNYFEDNDDVFSPSKIFTFYKDGFSYQIEERKTVGGKTLTVIEMVPSNKKTTYFKIQVTIDETALQIVESKIFDKNGTRYVYKITKQTPNTATTADSFTFDAKKYPGVKVVDLR